MCLKYNVCSYNEYLKNEQYSVIFYLLTRILFVSNPCIGTYINIHFSFGLGSFTYPDGSLGEKNDGVSIYVFTQLFCHEQDVILDQFFIRILLL